MLNYYVYILKNEENETYTGVSNDVWKRLKEHNEGLSRYTKRSAGKWKLSWYCVFKDREKAYKFEKYLKSGSGIAFLKKRFI
jgi:predicted GIY-YIG superfamily endonuclease